MGYFGEYHKAYKGKTGNGGRKLPWCAMAKFVALPSCSFELSAHFDFGKRLEGRPTCTTAKSAAPPIVL